MCKLNLNLGAMFGDSVSARRKHNFSKQHLAGAKVFAAEAKSIETTTPPPDENVRVKHRAYVTTAILSAVAFLEASINEMYLSAAAKDSTALPSFDVNTFKIFDEFWEEVKWYPILRKYQIALLLVRKERFDCGKSPFQEAESLVKLRDSLVHYKPEWDDEAGQHQKLESRLKAKFNLNPFAADGNLWFPHRCLGAGCADWSVKVASSFSDDFCDRLGIPKRTT